VIAVVGLGFVGITTALGFCEKGFEVFGIDTDQNKIELLKNNIVPFYEPGVTEALLRHNNTNFILASDIAEALPLVDTVIYCVGTPSMKNGEADLSYLISAIGETLSHIGGDGKKLLLIKSTIPPLTTAKVLKPFIEQNGFVVGDNILLANNPEFLREGCAWDDFLNPDRVVIGAEDIESRQLLESYYSSFGVRVHCVSWTNSEFIKYLSNTLLATLVSYANEMSMIADAVGDIDIAKTFKILHEDKRWFGQPAKMSEYVFPGCGFGGYCLPKDTSAMYDFAKSIGCSASGLKSTLDINNEIKIFSINKIARLSAVNESIAILGLSFKPGSDDVRNSPAADIIHGLLSLGYTNIVAYDPIAIDNFKSSYEFPIKYEYTLEGIIQCSNCIVITVAWDEFVDRKELFVNKNAIDLRYFIN